MQPQFAFCENKQIKRRHMPRVNPNTYINFGCNLCIRECTIQFRTVFTAQLEANPCLSSYPGVSCIVLASPFLDQKLIDTAQPTNDCFMKQEGFILWFFVQLKCWFATRQIKTCIHVLRFLQWHVSRHGLTPQTEPSSIVLDRFYVGTQLCLGICPCCTREQLHKAVLKWHFNCNLGTDPQNQPTEIIMLYHSSGKSPSKKKGKILYFEDKVTMTTEHMILVSPSLWNIAYFQFQQSKDHGLPLVLTCWHLCHTLYHYKNPILPAYRYCNQTFL